MNDDRPLSTTSTPDPVPAAADAGASLRQADELTARTRRASRWYARYMALFGLGFGLLTLTLGLLPDSDSSSPWWIAALVAIWAVFVVVMVVWSVRRPVHGKLDPRTYVAGWIGTGLLYGAALFAGLNRDLPVWAWVLAALVVALPLLVSASRVHRSLT